AKPARVLPQYDQRSRSTSLDSQPIHGGADATGQSAIASDATAPTHRRRNPGESLHGRPTLPEPAIPPVAVGHEREPIRQEPEIAPGRILGDDLPAQTRRNHTRLTHTITLSRPDRHPAGKIAAPALADTEQATGSIPTAPTDRSARHSPSP